MTTASSLARVGSVPQNRPIPGTHRLFQIGGVIVALCGGLGFLAGMLADGKVGFWAFIGLGVGILVATGVLTVAVFRRLGEMRPPD